MTEQANFLSRDDVLTLEEYARLVKVFVELGVHKVRITGGEPLVRKNALRLFETIGQLPGLHELVITTNGSQLEQQARALKQAGVKRVNISLDSLDARRFRQITRVGHLDKVLRGIAAAKQAGFENIRLNSLLMRGINDDEALDLVAFGTMHHVRRDSYVSNDQTLGLLRARYDLIASPVCTGGPARYWQIPNNKTKIGFISPHSHNFCEACNRIRISCQGELHLCLGREHAVDLKPFLRGYPNDDEPLKQAIIDSMQIKPKGHDFDLSRAEPAVIRFMSHTGG
jgi:cyclic pyranopterin phosphate synthase